MMPPDSPRRTVTARAGAVAPRPDVAGPARRVTAAVAQAAVRPASPFRAALRPIPVSPMASPPVRRIEHLHHTQRGRAAAGPVLTSRSAWPGAGRVVFRSAKEFDRERRAIPAAAFEC